MADDPINIVVTDGVDANILTKLNAIADASDKGSSNLDRLRASLASIRGDNLTTLREQANGVTAAIKAELDATNALATANTNTKTATAGLATEISNSKTKLDAETAAINANTSAAKANKEAKIGIGQSAGIPLGPTNIVSTGAATAQTAETYAAQMASHEAAKTAAADAAAIAVSSRTAKTAISETEMAVESLGTKAPGFFTRMKTAATGAFDGIKDFASGNGTRFRTEAEALAGGATKAGEELQKLSGHSRGSSTAIRELLVIAREGGRGDLNRMAGSVSILAGALGLLPIAIGTAIVGFVALAAARTTLNSEAEQKHLKDYAESLGLSEKEMRKLSNTTVDASGKMHEHNMLQVTYGDVFSGTVTTIKEGIAGIAKAYGITTEATKTFTTTAISFLKVFFSTLVGEIGAVINFFYSMAYNLVTAAQNVGVAVGNAIYVVLASLTQGVVEILNGLSAGFNAVSATVGGPVIKMLQNTTVATGDLLTGFKKFRGANFFGDVISGAKATNDALDKTGANILKAADARIKAEANAIKANRNPVKPKKDSTSDPKTKDDFLDDENLKLDNQIKLFGLLKDAREVQNQLDGIQEAFAKRRTPLNDAELKQFRDKLVLIQQNNKVQAEMDKIYNDINGPQQAFNIGQMALNKLLADGNINLQDYNIQLDKLQRSLDTAIDPMFALNEAIDKESKSLRLSGDELQRYNNEERVRQALLANHIDLRKDSGKPYAQAAKGAVDKLNSNDDAKYVTSQVSKITGPLQDDKKLLASKKNLYAQINSMAKKGEIDEQQRRAASAALDAKFSAMKLESAKNAFDQLATLSSSKNKTLATIGKAASVASATISGFEAVQNALATKAPWPIPLVFAGIAGVAAAVNVANIISTPVGNYWTGGDFIVRGKTGVDANRINMNVSDGERVTIQTQAQQQSAANDNKGGGKQGDTHIHNYFDEASFVGAMSSKEGDKVIMNAIARNKHKVNGSLK